MSGYLPARVNENDPTTPLNQNYKDTIMNDNVIIYIITDEAYTDYSESHVINGVKDIPDDDFIEMAVEEGGVFTLKGFEFDWNNYPMFMPHADNSYMRIICEK